MFQPGPISPAAVSAPSALSQSHSASIPPSLALTRSVNDGKEVQCLSAAPHARALQSDANWRGENSRPTIRSTSSAVMALPCTSGVRALYAAGTNSAGDNSPAALLRVRERVLTPSRRDSLRVERFPLRRVALLLRERP